MSGLVIAFNCNISHTTHFYDDWDEDKDSFTVPDSHSLVSMVRKYSNHPTCGQNRRNSQNRKNPTQNGPDDGLQVGNENGRSEGFHKFSQAQVSLLTPQANKIVTETENPSTAAFSDKIKSIFEQLNK